MHASPNSHHALGVAPSEEKVSLSIVRSRQARHTHWNLSDEPQLVLTLSLLSPCNMGWRWVGPRAKRTFFRLRSNSFLAV